MPLSWSEVNTDLDLKRFTMRPSPVLLPKTGAWKDYCNGQRSLEKAIKRLAKSMTGCVNGEAWIASVQQFDDNAKVCWTMYPGTRTRLMR